MNTAVIAGSPVEYVRSLPASDRQAVFMDLLNDAIVSHGDQRLIPFRATDGRSLGYFVKPTTTEQIAAAIANMTPEDHARGDRAFANFDNTFDVNELIDDLGRNEE